MDAVTVLVLGVIVGFVALYAGVVAGSVDALGQPRGAWQRAGFRRIVWVWQALAVFFLPAALVYTGLYFVRVRPRLIAAARDLAIEQGVAHRDRRPAEPASGLGVDKIKIGIPLSVAAGTALPLLVSYIVGMSLVALSAGFDEPLLQPMIWALVALPVALGNVAFGLTLTPHDLVMRGLIRRHIAWPDVVAITQESTLGSSYVRLWTRTGRRHRLRAPMTQFGIGRPRYDADFTVLEHWWSTHAPASD